MSDSEFDAAVLAAADPAALLALVRDLGPGELDRAAARHGDTLARLARHERLTAPQQHASDTAAAVLDAIATVRDEHAAARQAQVRSLVDSGRGRIEPGALRTGQDPGRRGGGDVDRRDERGQVFRDAEQAIAEASRSGLLPDHAAETVTALLERGPTRSRTVAARWAAATGSLDYARAFAKLLQDPERGHLVWTEDESAAFRAAAAVQDEMRAMSLSDSAGGYLVPFTLDPAIMLSSAGFTSTLRQRARVVTTATDSWSGVTSAGVSSEWLAEATEAAAATPTLGQPTIPVHKLSTYCEYSVEVGMDAVGFLAELQKIMLDAAATAAETAYTTGSGSGQPTGLVTALVASSPSVIVPSSTSNALVAADIYALQNALAARWQQRASWLAPLAIINTIAQFETSNGALKFPEVGNGQLLRRPLDESSLIDGTFGSGENYCAVYGDLSQFVIVDRIGATFELIPHVLGSNRRPTGQRGAWLYQRTGSDSVIDSAFALLNIT